MAEAVARDDVDECMALNPTSRVRFRPLTFREEGPEHVVGCRDVSVYISVPAVGVEAIRLLEAGATIEEAERRLAGGEDEAPDVRDFVDTLMQVGLVLEVDGRPTPFVPHPEADEAQGVSILRGLRAEHVGWLFGRAGFALHAAAFVAVLVLLALNPAFLPVSRDFFVLPWYSLNTALVVATCALTMFFHELGHVVAARAMGVDARLDVGRRLWNLVAESKLGDIWALPRRARMVVYLGGVIVNIWIFLACLLVAMQLGPSPAQRWLRLVMVLEFYSVAWQLAFVVKTDLHYFLADLFYARNLMEQSRAYLYGKLSRVVPRYFQPCDLGDLPATERRFVVVYAWISVVAIALAAVLFFGYIAPWLVRTVVGSLSALLAAHSAAAMTDAAVTLVALSVQGSIIAYVFWRDQARPLLRRLRAGQPVSLAALEG